MGYSKQYRGVSKLPEVIEMISEFRKRKYTLCWCDDSGARMQKHFTEVHFIPETDRLRVCIHDDGMGEKQTGEAIKLAEEIFVKYGYKTSFDELYKYF